MSVQTETGIDPKIIDRINKLLNLARDGGATEGEANSAMEFAERMMRDNNLSMAQIEMNGGAATEKRLKEQSKGKANYRWQRWMMGAIAEANFCYVMTLTGRRKNRHGSREISLGYEIIGRQSNVVSAYHMYDYMLATCARLRAEYEMQPGKGKEEGALFVEGLANRLAERIKERHEEALEKQKAEAERAKAEQATRASHPGAAPTGNALVVVMADYEQDERDANIDIANGNPVGTTANLRKEREARIAAKEAAIAALVATGVDENVAWSMVHFNKTQEQVLKDQAEAAARREKEAASGGSSRSRRSWGGRTREDRLRDQLYTGSAGEGRRSADNVSLDRQVDGKGTKRII